MGTASPCISKDLCPSEMYVIVESRGRQVDPAANLDVAVRRTGAAERAAGNLRFTT